MDIQKIYHLLDEISSELKGRTEELKSFIEDINDLKSSIGGSYEEPENPPIEWINGPNELSTENVGYDGVIWTIKNNDQILKVWVFDGSGRLWIQRIGKIIGIAKVYPDYEPDTVMEETVFKGRYHLDPSPFTPQIAEELGLKVNIPYRIE